MANRLPVPEELRHLIEKRNTDGDGTKGRRSGEERRDTDLGPIGALESGASLDELPTEDRRSRSDRRTTGERRSSNETPDDGIDSDGPSG